MGGGGGGGVAGVANTVKGKVYDPVAKSADRILSPVTSPLSEGFKGIIGAPDRWIEGMHNGGGGGGGGGGGAPAVPMPTLGDRTNISDANGNLNANFKYNANLGDQGALQALNARATGQGPSPWLSMQLQQQKMQQMDQANSAARGAAGANAQARAGLAMRGGLSGGAAERIARGGTQDLNARRQDIANQGAQQRITLGAQDEATKTGLLNNAVQANAAQAGITNDASKFNIGNQLSDTSAKNAWKQTEYQEKMKGYGAQNTANAIAASGGGGKK